MERDQFNKWFKTEFAARLRAMTPPRFSESVSLKGDQSQMVVWLARLLPWAQRESYAHAERLDWLSRTLDKYFAKAIVEDFAPKTDWFRELQEKVAALEALHAASLDHKHE